MLALLAPTLAALALVALGWLLIRRPGPLSPRGSSRRAIEVLERTPLGPKQGVTALRVADRVVVVSHGEGGVHPLVQLTAEEWAEADMADAIEREVPASSVPRFRLLGATARGRVAARALRGLFAIALVASVVGGPTPLAATAPGLQAQADSAASVGSLIQAIPPLLVQDEAGEDRLELNGPIGTALLIGSLALLPTLLLLATGFTRVLIVLHLLKQALGAQAVPPTHLVNALALLLTLFLMAPTLDRATQEAIDPWLAGEISQGEMFERVTVPFRDFMLEHTDDDDMARLIDLRGDDIPDSVEQVKLTTIIAAFTTSELRRAFQLGFVLFLPFIIIDLVVASVLMSMGMFMLPPVMISLPFKLLLFVLADGWSLVVGGLLSSFL